MNKYPALYEAVDGKRYLYTDKDNYYSFERNCWDKSDSADNHENDKNITAEYLVNTKVKIESEEHSELVQDLVFNAGGSWSSGSVQIKNLGAEWHFIDCELLISNSYQRDCDKVNMRLITIPLPLPPKYGIIDSEHTAILGGSQNKRIPSEWETKEESVNNVQVNVNNNTDSVVQVTKSDDESNIFIHVNDLPKSEEWPQVGDEVSFPSGKGVLVMDKPDINGVIIVKSTDADSIDEYKKVSLNALKKPPTPKDELDRKLYDFFQCNSEEDLAEAIINGEIEGLEYKHDY